MYTFEEKRAMLEQRVLEKIASAYEMEKLAWGEDENGQPSLGRKAAIAGAGLVGLYGAHKLGRRFSAGYNSWQEGARKSLSDKIKGYGTAIESSNTLSHP